MIAGLGGHSAAHRMFLQRLSGQLRAFYNGRLWRIGRSAAEAEDLVQEALVAVHIKRDSYDPGELLPPWVFEIARYKLIDHLRRTRASLAHVQIDEAKDLLAEDDLVAV